MAGIRFDVAFSGTLAESLRLTERDLAQAIYSMLSTGFGDALEAQDRSLSARQKLELIQIRDRSLRLCGLSYQNDL